MGNQPKVSILIPVYNTAKYLPKCMASVQRQSLKDIEIIAVNDASPDNAAEVLAEYAAHDPRIKVVTHEKNGGILAARLSGIAAATGEFLIFLDADDYLDTDTARACYAKAKKTGADMIHFCFDVRIAHRKKTHFAKKVEKRINPYNGSLLGRQVFEGAFVHYLYSWNIAGKFIAADVCRKAAAALPPGYYIMAEDFCFYTMMSWFATHYEPLFRKCYYYGLDIGVSNYALTDYQGFIRNCTVFTALKSVKAFLTAQGGWEQYHSAFEEQERRLLDDLLERWERKLTRHDRVRALDYMFENYSREGLMRSFISYFSGRENVLARLMGMPEFFTREPAPSEAKNVGLYLDEAVTGTEFPAMLLRCAGEWKNAGLTVTAICPEGSRPDLPDGIEQIRIPASLAAPSAESLRRRSAFWMDLREKYGMDTIVHGAFEEPEIIFDALSIKLSGLNLVAAPLTGIHMLADSSMGHFTAKMRSLQMADALAVQTDSDLAFFSVFGMNCGKIAAGPAAKPGPEPEKKIIGRKSLMWFGHLGDPEAEVMLSAWAKLAPHFPDFELHMVGRTRCGVSDRSILTLADMMKPVSFPKVHLDPADFSGLLPECRLLIQTSGETDCALYAEAAKTAGVPCFGSKGLSPESLAEELTALLQTSGAESDLPGPAGSDNGLALLRNMKRGPEQKIAMGNVFLQALDSYQLKFEPYVLLPENRGPSFIQLYRRLDELVYRILPPASPRRDWVFRACRYVLNRFKKKK